MSILSICTNPIEKCEIRNQIPEWERSMASMDRIGRVACFRGPRAKVSRQAGDNQMPFQGRVFFRRCSHGQEQLFPEEK